MRPSEADLERIEAAMASTSRPTSRSSARDIAVAEALERFQARGPALQGRADRGPGPRRGRRDRLALPQRPLHGPLPRPARALDRPDQGVQAELGRRRLLARRRDPPDADPDLRHRLPRKKDLDAHLERIEQATRARPPPARPRARPVHAAPGGAGDAVLAAAGHGAAAADRGRGRAPARASAATRRSRRRRCSTRSSGTAPATGTTTARTCTSSSRPSARATSGASR